MNLGRLVVDIRNPGQSFCPYAPIELTEADFAANDFKYIKEILNSNKSSAFGTHLNKLFSVFVGNTNTSFDHIVSQKATTYQLLNSDIWFHRLCENEQVKRWLEKFLKRSTVSLAVGLHTPQDPCVSLMSELDSEINDEQHDSKAKPTTTYSVATGEGSSVGKTQTISSFIAPDERIIAVQYRKIDFGLFSSRKVDNAFLNEANHWIFYGVDRGDGESDGVTANLRGSTSYNDYKVPFTAIYETDDGQEAFAFV